MIFVTVGAQMPFDRLVQAVDAWAGQRPGVDVFAQIGPTSWRPRHARWARFLDPPAFEAACRRADLLVAHAGMGSIITALELGKPILVMPRRGALGETRNDHQVATARRFADTGRVLVAFDEVELVARLSTLADGGAVALAKAASIGPFASPELLTALRGFVFGRRDTFGLCPSPSSATSTTTTGSP